MRLTDLVEESEIVMVPEAALPDLGVTDLGVTGLTADSRAVAPGNLFAALPGSRVDGSRFIEDARRRGAVALLTARGAKVEPRLPPVAVVADENPRRRLAQMAARFYGKQPRQIVGVTGTNGKTSVAEFTRQIWTALGRRAASLGTLGVIPPHLRAPGSLTTPDPVELHRCLADLADGGYHHLAMEASSHGLDQYRLDGVTMTAAAFTNLSRDHLDYHGDMAAYLAAKLRLFTDLLPAGGTAVLNADIREYDFIRAACERKRLAVMTYGEAAGDLRLARHEMTSDGQILDIELQGQRHSVAVPLVGAFQAGNVLAALGLAVATGADPDAAIAALPRLTGVRGRMEAVARTPNGARVYVDYAHTPDALATGLRALRPHTEKRLFVVFGAGGDRDPGKRPMMGEAAARHADGVYVTDDNPRSEDPAVIRRAILAAVPHAKEFDDRGEAIAAAVAALGPGDVLVVAGKGHELGQTVGNEVLPFDDRDVARTAVAKLTEEAG